MAEKFYVRGNMPKAAVEMYTKVNKYEAAYKVHLYSLLYLLLCVFFS